MIPTRLLRNALKEEPCLVKIKDALFKYDTKKSYIFPTPFSFEVYKPFTPSKPSFWAITGDAKTKFLEIVSGKYFPDPPLSRTNPFLASTYKYNRIQFLNFKESSGLDKVHLSARYETYSYKGKLEMSDDVNSVKNYITGQNNYNLNDDQAASPEYIEELLKVFNLEHLSHKWINSLSNGQLRRARLAKALITTPDLLLIDDPFLGLDPEATALVSSSLERVSHTFGISIIIGLRLQDKVPDWVSHVCMTTEQDGLKIQGPKETVVKQIEELASSQLHAKHESHHKPRKLQPFKQTLSTTPSHIEFKGASVVYKGVPVFTDFDWKVDRGSKWRILGNNGTGKTTLISLITADHPQSWRSVMSIDGVLRTTGKGVSFFDVNNKIGISSPELHALVPSNTKTMKQVILNGLVPDVGNSNFMFKGSEDMLTDYARSVLSKFQDRLDMHGDKLFQELAIGDQKLTLFLRAIIKKPEILVLDEAFSCMDNEEVMIRCHELVENDLPETTVLAIGHLDWELPKCDYVLKLTGDENRSYEIMKYVETD